MAKVEEKQKARSLRKGGMSILDIATKLGVAKSSVSIWCRDISLTEEQIQNLHESMVCGSYAGRLAGAHLQREKKEKQIQKSAIQAAHDIQTVKDRDLFLLGLGLYWGEGDKKSTVRFFNSDPQAVRIMMRWFRETLHIAEPDFMMYLNLNEAHAYRTKEIIVYWSKVTGVPVKQFRKPSLVRVVQKKKYDNELEYRGTLCIGVARSRYLLYQVLEWIKAVNMAG
jgi:transcriptional regulator with XRE-family HTH domain